MAEPTEAQIEAAARAIVASDFVESRLGDLTEFLWQDMLRHWQSLEAEPELRSEHRVEKAMRRARAALEAAEAAAGSSTPRQSNPNERLYLLKLDPQSVPVFFVVKHLPMDDEAAAYLFEEGSCPTNFIRCEEIIVEGDTDPHGLFEFVRSIPMPEELDQKHNPAELWRRLFPEVFTEPAGEEADDGA